MAPSETASIESKSVAELCALVRGLVGEVERLVKAYAGLKVRRLVSIVNSL